jgi:hypothetical protein
MRAGPVNGRVDLPGSVGDVPRLRGCGLFVEGFLVVAGKGCRVGGINVERPQPRERCDRHGDECRYTGHSAYRSRWDASPNGSRGSRPTAVEHCTQVSRRQLWDRRSVAAPTVTRSRRHRRLVGSGAGAVPARSPRPGVTPRTGQRSPGHWVANEPGTRGDMTGHRVRWAATKATSAPIIAASRACRLAVSYGPPYCPVALARVTTRHTRRRFVSSRSHPAALRRCCDKGAESRSAPSQFTSNTANRRLATCSCLGTSGHQ